MELTLKDVRQMIKEFTGQDRSITIPRVFIDLTGSHIKALVLNQILFWNDKTHNSDGWFYKSAKEWDEEAALSYDQVTRAANQLKNFGVETKLKRANNAPTTHYRINEEVFYPLFLEFLENRKTLKSENPKMDFQESPKSNSRETRKSLTDESQLTTTVDIPATRQVIPFNRKVVSPEVALAKNFYTEIAPTYAANAANMLEVEALSERYGAIWFRRALTEMLQKPGQRANNWPYLRSMLSNWKQECRDHNGERASPARSSQPNNQAPSYSSGSAVSWMDNMSEEDLDRQYLSMWGRPRPKIPSLSYEVDTAKVGS